MIIYGILATLSALTFMCLSSQQDRSLADAKRFPMGNTTGKSGEIRVMCQCAIPLTERLCNFFTRQGVTVVAVMDDWFIVKGKPDQINRLKSSNLVSQVTTSVPLSTKR